MKNTKYIKYNPAVLILVMFSLQTFGQTAEVVRGPLYKMSEHNWFDIDPIGEDAAGYYYLLHTLSKEKSVCAIGVASQKDMKLDKISQVKLVYEKNDLELQFGLELDGTSYIISSYQNDKLQKVFLVAHALDRANLSLKGNPIAVTEIDYSKLNKYKNATLSYRLSPDRSKVLFMYNLKDKDNSMLASGITIVDQRLTQLHQVFETTDNAGVYQFVNYFLSNNGTAFLLRKYFDTKKDYRTSRNLKKQGVLSNISVWEEEANFDYQITKIDKGIQKTLTLDLPAAFITQVELTTKDDGGILIVGFYSEDPDAIPDRLFTQNINSQLNVTSTDQRSLEGKFNEPLKYTNNSYKGKRNDLSHFKFDTKKIITRKEGGYAFAAERSVTLTETIKTGPTTSTSFGIFHTDDILLVDIKRDGKINWLMQIEKSQEITGGWTHFGSFAFEESNNNLLLFFANNIGKRSFKSLSFKVFESESTMVIVRPDETTTKQILFTAAADQITLRADKTSKASNGSIVLYGEDGKSLVGFCNVGF